MFHYICIIVLYRKLALKKCGRLKSKAKTLVGLARPASRPDLRLVHHTLQISSVLCDGVRVDSPLFEGTRRTTDRKLPLDSRLPGDLLRTENKRRPVVSCEFRPTRQNRPVTFVWPGLSARSGRGGGNAAWWRPTRWVTVENSKAISDAISCTV